MSHQLETMSERPQRTCSSKYRREIVVEDQMVEEVIEIDKNLVPTSTNDWDSLIGPDEIIEIDDPIIVPDTPAAALTITTLPEHSPSTPSLPNVTPSTPYNPYIVHKRQDNVGVNDTIDRLLCIVEAQQNSIAELIKQNQNQQMRHQLQQLALQKQTERLECLIERLDNKQETVVPNVQTSTVKATSKTMSTKPKETPPTNVKKLTKSPKAPERKRIEIFGDSMIGGVKSQYMSAKNNYKIHSYGGGTSEDMVDLVKIGMRRKPEVVILHSGTNDVTTSNVNIDVSRLEIKLPIRN